MLNLNELAKTSFEIAEEKGWWSKPRSMAALSLLKISEISEALEDYRGNRDLRELVFETPGEEIDGVIECQILSEVEAEKYRQVHPEEALKPCGIPSEIADVLIRIADFFGKHGEDLDAAYRNYVAVTPRPNRYNPKDFENALAFSTLRISKAFETWTNDKEEHLSAEVFHHFAGSLQPLFETCEHHQIPLAHAIELKTRFNRTRKFRHGGKKI